MSGIFWYGWGCEGICLTGNLFTYISVSVAVLRPTYVLFYCKMHT